MRVGGGVEEGDPRRSFESTLSQYMGRIAQLPLTLGKKATTLEA